MQPRIEHFRGGLVPLASLNISLDRPALDDVVGSTGCCLLYCVVGDTASERLWE